jgi:DNA-binding CsgD family transcriptional regulator
MATTPTKPSSAAQPSSAAEQRGAEQATASFLALVAPHLPPALEQIKVPAYVIDSAGRIRWLNDAAKRLVGDAVGKLFTSVIEPDQVRRARSQFAENLQSRSGGEFAIDLLTESGEELRVEISSVALRGKHQAIGMFGLVLPRQTGRDRPAKLDDRLTRRQHEILELIAEGESTDQIASDLHLSRETVRNHVRHILQRLGTSSRLEAVALARREELI